MYSSRNCTGYLYCLNGVEASTGYCPTGSYFDERSGACMEGASDPLLGCCNPEYYDATGSTTEADSDSTTEASGAATSDDSETTEETVTDSNDDATTEASA